MIKKLVSQKLIWQKPLLAFDRGKKFVRGVGRQGFEAKKYYPKAWRFFCSNPKGIGLANRRGITLPQQKPKKTGLDTDASNQIKTIDDLKKGGPFSAILRHEKIGFWIYHVICR